jgi:lipid-A-disaccharide synthase-like uncharacterized protein
MFEMGVLVPYSATGISILGRFIFMYLLYTKRSTNIYSLIFCYLNLVSSSLWIVYSVDIENQPLLVRSSIDIALFVLSSSYIMYNRKYYRLEREEERKEIEKKEIEKKEIEKKEIEKKEIEKKEIESNKINIEYSVVKI